MGVANTKSTGVTNADSTQPRLPTAGYLVGANIKMSVGTVEVAAADDNDSVYRMVRLPSNAIVYRIETMNDAITGGTDFDIGLYKIETDGGLVADKDRFASAIDMSTARSLALDAGFEALGIEQVEKRLWELLGLASDPQTSYDLSYHANTVGSGAGTLSMRVMWAV
jgi:hypothetical protein